ncbi:hypothetical protein HZA97_00625 [Candidatus Woesearchaeota archaeon]|nr:hypothetical protein [Candidatus Woesearchaeota archaeon]
MILNPGAIAAASAAAAARRRRIREEERKHAYVSEHLEEIIAAGKDETVWSVKTNVSGLPDYRKSFFEWFFGLKGQYKIPEESSEQYMRRAFESFDFYLSNGLLIAGKGNLSLKFELKTNPESIEQRETVLFQPRESRCEAIKAVVPFRVHPSEIIYRTFSMCKNLEGLTTEQLPYKINFVE